MSYSITKKNLTSVCGFSMNFFNNHNYTKRLAQSLQKSQYFPARLLSSLLPEKQGSPAKGFLENLEELRDWDTGMFVKEKRTKTQPLDWMKYCHVQTPRRAGNIRLTLLESGDLRKRSKEKPNYAVSKSDFKNVNILTLTLEKNRESHYFPRL